ncbi:MAG: hypothetical protein R3B96_17675 [Pirellulaceae bacterium]
MALCDRLSTRANRISRATDRGLGARDWSEFVGSDSCRECHAEICDRYQAHPMAQAMCLASSEAETIEDYAAGEVGFTTAGHLRYEVRRSGDDVWHTEQKLTDDDQSVKWEQSEPVLFAMGSGTRGRSYVLVENGRMFESPISWYTGTDQWDLSPGYPPQSHNRFNREIAGPLFAMPLRAAGRHDWERPRCVRL